MKNILILFSLLISGLFLAQSPEQKQILQDTQSFMTFLEQKNYDKILEMSHPALTEKFERKVLVDAFKMIFEGNEEFGMKLKPIDSKDYDVSEVFEFGNSRYAFVSYPMEMEMRFKQQKLDANTKKMMATMMEAQGMKAEFLDDSTAHLRKLALTLALKDKSTNNEWKYLNHDGNNPLYTTIVPAEIIKKARSYYSDLLLKQRENAN